MDLIFLLELLAAIASSLHAARVFDSDRSMPHARDFDGNIVSSETTDVRTYKYATGLIPSKRLEELLCLMAKDYRQALFVYHQMVQGENDLTRDKIICY